MAATATWDYSIYNVSGLSHDDAWKKLRDLPLPPISDQLATYYQQRVAQSAHFEDVETLIANNHDDDDDDEGHQSPSRARTGLLSPSPSPVSDAPAASVYGKKDTLHGPEAISTSTSHPSLQDRPLSPEAIPSARKSQKSPLPRRLASPPRSRQRSSAMTTRSRATRHTSFFALDGRGKPQSACPSPSASTSISAWRPLRNRQLAKNKVEKPRQRAR